MIPAPALRRGRVHPYLGSILLVVGLLLVGGNISLLWEHPPAPVETLESPAPERGPLVPAPQERAFPAPTSSPAPVVGVTQVPLPDRPQSLQIPDLGITSELLHLGLHDDGSLQVPDGEDYHRAAWYTGSPTPGMVGPSVIQGHVESRRWGPSVFHRLKEAIPGTRIEVTGESGTVHSFVVHRVEHYAKDSFPTFTVYKNVPTPELRLITCSGVIGPDGHYDHNTVVYAHLA